MDCLEFRRLIGSEPRLTDPAARAHLESCARCQDAYARAQALEARIAGALAVAVPEGLADRVLLAQLTGERQRRAKGFRYGWIALAAGVRAVAIVWLIVDAMRLPAPEWISRTAPEAFSRTAPKAVSRTANAPAGDRTGT